MHRLLSIPFLWLTAVICAHAQVSISDVLKQMPDSIIPYLSQNNRLDCIDFMASGMKAEVTNALGGKSELRTLTIDYLSFWLNESSTLQMRLLNVTEPVDSCTQIVCMVRTYGTTVKESQVSFFSLKWRPLPTADYLSLPGERQPLIATLSPDDDTLTLTPETRFDPPANEYQEEIHKSLIKLKWRGKYVNIQ